MLCDMMLRFIRQHKNMLQAALAQQVARILGKDEVGGSNPLGSFEMIKNKVFSRKSFFEMSLFLFYYPNE